MEEDNFIEELDKRRKLFYYGGIAALVLAFLILYAVLFYKNPFSENGAKPENGQTEEVGNGGKNEKAQGEFYHVASTTKEDCLALSNDDESQRCLDNVALDEAIDNNLFSECNEIKSESARNDCMHRIAHNQKSVELCLKIPDQKIKETCVSDVAISLKDPSVCAVAYQQSFELKECQDVATAFVIAGSGKKEDIKECAEIETKEYSNLCFLNSYVAKYGGDCAKVPTAYRQYCVDYKAMEGAEKTGDCDVIKDPDYKDFCLIIAKLGILEARNVDTDGDGITDGNELFMKTDPKNTDTDTDGLTDGQEWVFIGTDPGNADTDEDGLNDYQEDRVYHADPKNPDTDGDGKADGLEVKSGRDPLVKD
jgi:hypothetical protein